MGSLHRHDDAAHPVGMYRLPLRIRDAPSHHHTRAPAQAHHKTLSSLSGSDFPKDKDALTPHFKKHCPDSLDLLNETPRVRSPTELSMSTLCSVPDSATTASTLSTTGSLSTVASPLSSVYTSDFHEFLASSRPSSRIRHRHKSSIGTCSTFVNDEDDVSIVSGFPGHSHKVSRTEIEVQDIDVIAPEFSRAKANGPFSPSAEIPLIEEEDDDDDQRRLTFYEESPPCETPSPSEGIAEDLSDDFETQSDVSEDDSSVDEIDSVLNYALQIAYGVDIQDSPGSLDESRKVVKKFMQDLGHIISHAGPESHSNAMSISNSTSSTPGNSSSGGDPQRGGKRKKQTGAGNRNSNGSGRGAGDEEGEEFNSDGDADGPNPPKKPKPNPYDEDNLRLSCPFRKRNPSRFNVRDYHSCAMTYFPKFAELRQHIVKQHKRDDPSAHVCDRCNRDFHTRKELREHCRLPRDQMCEATDNDHESGIDGSTATKLLSRKRASGTSPEVQWNEIWTILFPDDDRSDIPPFNFTPVIEHFELSESFLASVEFLRMSLRDKISNPATLDTLANQFTECFMGTLARCVAAAQNKPYANRSNKRGEQLAAASAAAASARSRKSKDVLPRPDSGVVMTDDGSDESSSVMGGGSGMPTSSNFRAPAQQRNSNFSTTSTSTIPNTGANIAPAQPTSGVFDGFPMPPSSTSAPMAVPVSSATIGPADVQAWTQGVMYQPVPGMPDGNFGVHPANINMTQDLPWPQSFYNPNAGSQGIEEDYSGFL